MEEVERRLKAVVERLCDPSCGGRAPGTPGGARARQLVRAAFQEIGLEVLEQPVPGLGGGANVVGALNADAPRLIMLAAHVDHLGIHGGAFYPGADDNAAGVAIMLEVARSLAMSPEPGCGVLFAAFDGEEPPYFLSSAMGSEYFAAHPPVPIERLELMICMDLVGHAVGPVKAPPDVRDSLFALGAEHTQGLDILVDSLADAEDGLRVRRLDADVIPPLSDYWAFARRSIPFLFFTCGRWAHYHTPEDTPEKLDASKMAATARWLGRLLRAVAGDHRGFQFEPDRRADASTLRTLLEIASALRGLIPSAVLAIRQAEALLTSCDEQGRAPVHLRSEIARLVEGLEGALSS